MKTFFLLILLFWNFNSFAQITINRNNFSDIGQTIYELYLDIKPSGPGPAGKSVVWDFSNIKFPISMASYNDGIYFLKLQDDINVKIFNLYKGR